MILDLHNPQQGGKNYLHNLVKALANVANSMLISLKFTYLINLKWVKM